MSAKRVTFPLTEDQCDPWPRGGDVCLVCSHQIRDEGIGLSAGALWMSKDRQVGGFHERMSGFFGIKKEVRSGEDTKFVSLPVVEGLSGGQFELRFCSSDCCKAFLVGIVDELDARMNAKQKGLP